mgnify:CR=1 FL=1
MKPQLSIALLLAAAASQAGWMPDSPILRAGDDVDIYFTARARFDYNSNLFFGSAPGLPNHGSSWTIGPGLSADFFKEANLSASAHWQRDFVRFLDAKLKGLDDERDVGGATLTYDGGGPLTLHLEGSYQEDARNTSDLITLVPPFDSAGTLLRQTLYSQSATLGYRLTDKISLSLAATHSSNRYDPVKHLNDALFNTQGLTESNGWTFPLNIRYQVRERLNVGLSYEHGAYDITRARLSTAPLAYTGFTKDFTGLTLSGQPTPSRKLDVNLKVGYLKSVYNGGVDPHGALSYSVALTHTLTEKTNHSLSFGQDSSIAVNGRRSNATTGQYTLNYVRDDAFRASAFAGLSTSAVEVGAPASAGIRTGSYGVNATYSPDSHWTYVASYTLTQAYAPNTYNVQQIALEANLRW